MWRWRIFCHLTLWRIFHFVSVKQCFWKYYNCSFHSKNSFWASFLFQPWERHWYKHVWNIYHQLQSWLCRLSQVYVDLCYDTTYDHADKKLVCTKSRLFIYLLTDQVHCSGKYGIVIEKTKNRWINDIYVGIYHWFVCHPLYLLRKKIGLLRKGKKGKKKPTEMAQKIV